jgi:Flp pilus assembly protein TadB
VEFFLLGALGFVIVIYAVFALWKGADDRDWELRWASLDDLDRAWLAAASRSSANRATLEARGELDLAKGFGRREARRRAYILMATLAPFIVVAVLMLTGPLSDRFAPLVLGSFALLQSLVTYFRDRRIKDRYRETQNRYLAAPDADAASMN